MIIVKKFEKDGCVPCKVLDNYLRELDLPSQGIVVQHVNISRVPDVIDHYKLTGAPTLIIERNGVEMSRLVGLINPQEILDAIEYAKEAK